jgi:hypothetical protein
MPNKEISKVEKRDWRQWRPPARLGAVELKIAARIIVAQRHSHGQYLVAFNADARARDVPDPGPVLSAN